MGYQKLCTCLLKNNTSQSMALQTRELTHGVWSNLAGEARMPPNVLGPHDSFMWRSESQGLFTGTAGVVTYRCDDGTIFEIKWENPFCGDNEASMLPIQAGGLSSTRRITQGSHASAVFTLDERMEEPTTAKPPSQGAAAAGVGEIIAETGKTTPASPALPCMIPAAGWPIFRAIEAGTGRNADGTVTDKFASRTCMPDSRIAFYFPREKQSENRVHVLYSAVAVDNNVALHAARAASEAAGWILVALNTDPESDTTQITAKLICDHLKVHGWRAEEAKIDRLRLSAHSRGILKLHTNVMAGNLVSKTPTGDVFDIAKVERVVSIDASHTNMPVGSALALFATSIGFAFRATPNVKWTAGTRTVDLLNQDPTLIRTMVAIRCLTDAPTLRPTMAIEPKIAAVVASLGLPAMGDLSSHNYGTYLAKLKGILADPAVTVTSSQIESAALESNDQHFVHNFFAADFFHEITSMEDPKLG